MKQSQTVEERKKERKKVIAIEIKTTSVDFTQYTLIPVSCFYTVVFLTNKIKFSSTKHPHCFGERLHQES